MLRLALLLNALSCFVFGVLMSVVPQEVGAFLGETPSWVLRPLGLLLLVNAALLLVTMAFFSEVRPAILFFSFGDAAWVVLTGVLITTGTWITTSPGSIVAIGVALFVGICGLTQFRLSPS